MATLKTPLNVNWTNQETATVLSETQSKGIWSKFIAFVDGQKHNRTLWFLISLSVHAAGFLPIPVLLIGYFHAPVAVLGVTMVSFFANFVANMGGSGIRVTLSFFFASIIIHVLMIVLVLFF